MLNKIRDIEVAYIMSTYLDYQVHILDLVAQWLRASVPGACIHEVVGLTLAEGKFVIRYILCLGIELVL